MDCPPLYVQQQPVNQFNDTPILRDEFPHLRSPLPSLSGRSYYIGSAGHVSTETIQNYIKQQKRS